MKTIHSFQSNGNGQKVEKKSLYVLTQFYPPDYAPTGQLIQELVNYLGSQGNTIQVFTGQPGYIYARDTAPVVEQVNGVLVQRMGASHFWSQRIRGKLVNGLLFFLKAGLYSLKKLKKEDTLLLTTAPPFLPILGYFLHIFVGVSYVCLIYDLYPDVAVQLGVVSSNNWLAKLWDFCNRLTWNKAEQIIVLSSSMRERVLAKHPQLAYKISVIHNWANPNWIVPIEKSQNWFARQYNLVENFTVLYSGNMGRCHDLTTVLEAAHYLRDEPIQFVFIGDGAEYQTCIDAVKDWDLQNCRFLSYQDRQVLPYSLTACDLSLVSQKAGLEGVIAPSKLYSMLASGRPVAAICEQYSYLRQIIERAKCGEAFQNGDGIGLSQFIRRLALEPKLAARMGQAGRAYLTSNFILEIIAEQYSKVLGLRATVRTQQNGHSSVNGFKPIWQGYYSTKPVGQILQEVGLLSAVQVDEILKEQATRYHHLRFGEIAIYKGWLKQETLDFILNYAKPLSQAVQDAYSLLTVELDEIIKNRTIQERHLRLGELAVLEGWIKEETMNLLLERT